MLFEFATKPAQPGLSSSSRLESMMEQTQPVQTSSIRHGFRNDTDTYKSCIHRYTTSERIELKSPGCSAFEANLKSFKT